MNPETLYFVAVALCGLGLVIFGAVTFTLARKVRALETKLEGIPVRYLTQAVEISVKGGGASGGILDEPTGTGAHLVDEIKAAVQRLPKGRGLT